MISRTLKLLAAGLALTVLGGCVAPKTVDYSAYKQARPKTILVLPPLNTSPDVKASYSLLSQVTFPLAEGRLLRAADHPGGRNLPPERPDHPG